jgi:hypothetical protein
MLLTYKSHIIVGDTVRKEMDLEKNEQNETNATESFVTAPSGYLRRRSSSSLASVVYLVPPSRPKSPRASDHSRSRPLSGVTVASPFPSRRPRSRPLTSLSDTPLTCQEEETEPLMTETDYWSLQSIMSDTASRSSYHTDHSASQPSVFGQHLSTVPPRPHGSWPYFDHSPRSRPPTPSTSKNTLGQTKPSRPPFIRQETFDITKGKDKELAEDELDFLLPPPPPASLPGASWAESLADWNRPSTRDNIINAILGDARGSMSQDSLDALIATLTEPGNNTDKWRVCSW